MGTINAIGLMSGTSLDGLDLCHCSFTKNSGWEFAIHHGETIPYPELWQNRLKNATKISSEELLELHSDYGFYLGVAVDAFIKKHKIPKPQFISSHGHTVFHQPEKRFTLQIGDGRAICATTGIPTVYDFRQQDVLLGGNGAPLVPIGDELLFGEYDACLNLGGFSNISLSQNTKRIAFDICPVNTVLNFFAEKLGKPYDADGNFAQQGIINDDILLKLNNLYFYKNAPPKSLGTEFLDAEIFPIVAKMPATEALATLTAHIAEQISITINSLKIKNLLVTGGGAYNQFLMKNIAQKSDAQIIIPERNLIDYKEALIFAFLGVLKMRGEINVLGSATGASRDHSAGILASF